MLSVTFYLWVHQSKGRNGFLNKNGVFDQIIKIWILNDFDYLVSRRSDEFLFWKVTLTKYCISSRFGLLCYGFETELKIDEVLVATRVPDCDLSNRSKENTVMRFGQTKTMTTVDKLLLSISYIIIYESLFVHDESLILCKSWINLINQTEIIICWRSLFELRKNYTLKVLIEVRVSYFVNNLST